MKPNLLLYTIFNNVLNNSLRKDINCNLVYLCWGRVPNPGSSHDYFKGLRHKHRIARSHNKVLSSTYITQANLDRASSPSTGPLHKMDTPRWQECGWRRTVTLWVSTLILVPNRCTLVKKYNDSLDSICYYSYFSGSCKYLGTC